MSQVIAWILFIFVLIFIYKVGSFIWRILGVLFLLFYYGSIGMSSLRKLVNGHEISAGINYQLIWTKEFNG
ncbi:MULTISPECIES: hypothetical protein [Enterococcus]|uniref:hypothetical protein n=1 Tax=Enterococcus TaxID=1350 RepID=UPI0034A3334D